MHKPNVGTEICDAHPGTDARSNRSQRPGEARVAAVICIVEPLRRFAISFPRAHGRIDVREKNSGFLRRKPPAAGPMRKISIRRPVGDGCASAFGGDAQEFQWTARHLLQPSMGGGRGKSGKVFTQLTGQLKNPGCRPIGIPHQARLRGLFRLANGPHGPLPPSPERPGVLQRR